MLAKVLTGTTTGLDGTLVEVEVHLAQGLPNVTVVVPAANAAEAALIEGMCVVPIESLGQLAAHLNGAAPIAPVHRVPPERSTDRMTREITSMADENQMPSAGERPAGRAEKIRWAPKVRPEKIRRLYERDALGIHDDELIDDAGTSLHARCRSIVLVNDGQVQCPRCGTVFKVHRTYRERSRGEAPDDPERVVPCPQAGCGWQTTVGEWGQSWRHRELHAGWGLPPIREFCERYPLAITPRARMLLIDQLLHAFHHDLRNAAPHRSVAHNLIEGNHRQALALLDSLAYGDHSTPEVRNTYAAWRAQAPLRE